MENVPDAPVQQEKQTILVNIDILKLQQEGKQRLQQQDVT